MTLEDFFTSTEMKDGLKAPDQVKELVNVMEKGEHNVVKSVGDAIRQWSTVAQIITATENKDYLALFLQLNGLYYFDTWLKNSQKFAEVTGDSSSEDLITALLGAIEKLNIDRERLVTSGIILTVKNLLSYKSSSVQNMARDLFVSWKENSDTVADEDVQKVEAFCQGLMDGSGNPVSEREHPECCSHDTSPSGGIDSEEKNSEPGTDEIVPETYPETTQQEGVDELTDRPSDKPLERASIKDGPLDLMHSSDTLNLVSENNSVMENSPTHQSEVTTEIRTGPETRTLEGHQGFAESNEHDHAMQMPQIKSSDKLSATDISFCGDSTNTVESKVDATTKKDVDAEEGDPCTKTFSPGDGRKEVSEEKDEMRDNRVPNHCSVISAYGSTAPIDEYEADVMQDSSISEHSLGKNDELTTYSWKKDETATIEESNDGSDTDKDEDDLENDSLSRSEVDAKDSDVKRSDYELDYGMFDPLEVARQVAIEVEREVDCGEQSCSSSKRTFSGGTRLRESLYSTKGRTSQVVDGPYKDMSTEPDISAARDRPIKAKNLISKRDPCILDTDPSRVTETAQTSKPDSDKRICDFDLNEEVVSDDRDDHINPVTAPISLVSASRATAASGLPVSPLRFEGTLGWKGSAETSAFRPAPPRKVSEVENSIFASEHSNKLCKRQEYLDFDLNVSESEDNKIADLTLSKEFLCSTGLTFGDGSLEALPKTSERLQLDLNCVSDGGGGGGGGGAPSSNWKEGHFLPHWNGHLSMSPSSSSTRASLINIDLNNQPSHFTEFLEPAGKSSPNLFTSGGSKRNEAVISLMGAKVEVNQKNIFPQAIPIFSGSINPALDGSMTRNDSLLVLGSSSTYAHPSIYGYNGPISGPAVPFSSPVYGHGGQIPYMVDSRGSPVVPQVLGSVSALPPAFSQPSFLLNMAGAPSDPNRFLPSQHRFHLNSGMIMEGGNRDAGNPRQLFNSGQGITIGEHMRANSESTSSSGVGGKRKEPEGGWDPYPFNYKHNQPPWK